MDALYERALVLSQKCQMNQRHVTIITHNNKIIVEEVNYTADYLCHKFSIHSEVAAIASLMKKVPNRSKHYTKECSMYVFRVGRDSSFRMSRPCKNCEQAICNASIGKVFYSTDNPDLPSPIYRNHPNA